MSDADLAERYDQNLADTALFDCDLQFAKTLFSSPASLVDLGCGTGRLLIPFAQAGFRVLGVDLSAEMLRVARAKALSVPLIQANLVELDCLRDASFDYAACLFSTLGMISGVEHRQAVLAHAYRILKPGGRFLLHVHNRWFHLHTRAGRRWLIADGWRRMRGSPNSGDFEMPAHHGIGGLALHHFSRGEIVRELTLAGFRQIRVEPVSLCPDCRLPLPWLVPGLRAYGFLLSCVRSKM